MSIFQKNKKTAAGIGIAAAAAAALALSAGTYAAFFDEETGPGGTLAAATLDLTVGGAPNQALILDIGNITPGKDLPPKTLTIKNSGSVAGKLTGFVTVSGTDGTCTEPEQAAEGSTTCAAGGNLHEQIKVTVNGLGQSQTLSLPLLTNQQFVPGNVVLQPGQQISATVDFALPDQAGTVNNKVQGDTLTIASTLRLEQQN